MTKNEFRDRVMEAVEEFLARPDFSCLDCGRDCFSLGHHYNLRDDLWKELVGSPKGYLCFDCLEKRKGSPVELGDFSDLAVNSPIFLGARIVERREP